MIYGPADTCRHGHVYTAENTLWDTKANGKQYRRCRACRREQRTAAKRRENRRTMEDLLRDRRERDERIRELYAQGWTALKIADHVGCAKDTVLCAVNPEYAIRRRGYRSRMGKRARTPLMVRHAAALKIVGDLPKEKRWDLLAAVVWPEDERLEEVA